MLQKIRHLNYLKNDIMIISNLFLSFCILLLALALKVYPPKNINPYYGYRTKRSMSSYKNWKIANNVYSNYFLVSCIITILIQCVLFFGFDKLWALIVTSVLWVFSIFFPIYLTERYLKKRKKT